MFQKLIFDKILTKHTNQAEALKSVSELLYLNKSNVYRRFSGDIALKPQEIELLAKHYNISLDELVYADSRQFLAQYIEASENIEIKSYLEALIRLTEYAIPLPDYTYYVSSTDMLISRICQYPELFYFKTVQWNRLLWKGDTSFVYDPNQLTEKEKSLMIRCNEISTELNIIEFLNRESISLILEQLVYTYNIGVMSISDVELFLTVFSKFMNEFEMSVASGHFNHKKPNSKYEAYYSSTPNLNLLGFGETSLDAHSYIISLYNSPNILFSTDPKMVKLAKEFYRIKISKSTLITQAGELTRRQLFTHYRKQIRQVKRQLLGK